jgi:hypothetical protein
VVLNGLPQWRKLPVLTGRRLYKAIKEQIDQRGPINYNNAMTTANAIVDWMEERGYTQEKEEDIKVGLDTTD